MFVLNTEHNEAIIAEGNRRAALIVGTTLQDVLQSGFGGVFSRPVFWWFDQFYVKNNEITLLAAGTRLEVAQTDLLFAERKLISFKLQLARAGFNFEEMENSIRFMNPSKSILLENEVWKGYALAKLMAIVSENPLQGF